MSRELVDCLLEAQAPLVQWREDLTVASRLIRLLESRSSIPPDLPDQADLARLKSSRNSAMAAIAANESETKHFCDEFDRLAAGKSLESYEKEVAELREEVRLERRDLPANVTLPDIIAHLETEGAMLDRSIHILQTELAHAQALYGEPSRNCRPDQASSNESRTNPGYSRKVAQLKAFGGM